MRTVIIKRTKGRKSGVERTLLVLIALGSLLLIFSFARFWFHGWGATAEEQAASLPGDAIVMDAVAQETRAITINAPAERVWPWLAQVGQDRAGFYSYDILEDLVGCRMPNIQRLDPNLQSWRPGDKLWMYPPDKLGGVGSATLEVLQPGRALGFATRQIGTPVTAPANGSWSFIVAPVNDLQSRLIMRGRAAGGQGTLAAVFSVLAFEPMHFAMERKMMLSIKTLAEGGRVSSVATNVQVLSWTLTFAGFVAAAVLSLTRRQSLRRLAMLVGAGLLFQALTLAQPSPWLGVPAALLLLAAIAWAAWGRRASVPIGAAHGPSV